MHRARLFFTFPPTCLPLLLHWPNESHWGEELTILTTWTLSVCAVGVRKQSMALTGILVH